MRDCFELHGNGKKKKEERRSRPNTNASQNDTALSTASSTRPWLGT
jgi:hypothetical protein